MLLSLVDSPTAPAQLQSLPYVTALRTTWSRNLQFDEAGAVRLRPAQEAALRDEQIESPYDPEAQFRSKSGMSWTGYMAHFSETCDDKNVHLITNVHMTPADVHEAMCTDAIHKNMANHGLQPRQHFVDSAYMSADLLVHSADHGVELIGPQRIDSRWQSRVEGAYTADQFTVDWISRVVTCPQGARSTGWGDHVRPDGKPYHKVSFPTAACRECQARALCTRSKQGARRLLLHQQKQQEALQAARQPGSVSRPMQAGPYTHDAPALKARCRKPSEQADYVARAIVDWIKRIFSMSL